MANSRSAEWYRRIYRDASLTTSVATGTAGADALIAGKTGHRIYVQKISVLVTTAAAQSITFQSDNGTPLIIGIVPASAPAGSFYEFDYGPTGIELGITDNVGDDLDISGTAGPAYTVTVDAYHRQTAALTEAQAAAS